MRCAVLVQWMVWLPRSRSYGQRRQWHRSIEAPTLTQACRAAVAQHAGTICPSVSAAWPIFPQP